MMLLLLIHKFSFQMEAVQLEMHMQWTAHRIEYKSYREGRGEERFEENKLEDCKQMQLRKASWKEQLEWKCSLEPFGWDMVTQKWLERAN